MRALIALCAALALTALLVACGGGDEEERGSEPAPAPAVPAAGRAYAQISPDDLRLPEPRKGKVVASSGFDITTESFAFPNYGKTRGPQLRPPELRELFGDGVCVEPGAAECVLTPAAESWRQTVNSVLSVGHCYGFAVLSLMIHRGEAEAQDYGASTTHGLRIADAGRNVINPDLHADLSRSAASQFLATAQRRARRYTPTQALEELRRGMASGDKDYLLAVAFPDVGGHVVVPIGIEDLGGGQFDVLLYDNNFPYVPGNPGYSDRRLRIDTNADRWELEFSLRPDAPGGRWYGQGKTNRIELRRMPGHELPQPCPFCRDAPKATRTTVALGGDPDRIGHLRITDPEGNVTGWNGERFVNEIPGAELHQSFVLRRELLAPEPYVTLPPDGRYTIEHVDGAQAAALHVTGRDLGVGVSRLGSGGALTLGGGGAVALRAGDGAPPELRLAAPGDREVRLVPEGARLAVSPLGDDVRIVGQVERGVALNPAAGVEARFRGGGRVDLDELVGRAP